MAQKTLWSFFSKSPKNQNPVTSENKITSDNDDNESDNVIGKKSTKLKRRRISSSDEDVTSPTKSNGNTAEKKLKSSPIKSSPTIKSESDLDKTPKKESKVNVVKSEENSPKNNDDISPSQAKSTTKSKSKAPKKSSPKLKVKPIEKLRAKSELNEKSNEKDATIEEKSEIDEKPNVAKANKSPSPKKPPIAAFFTRKDETNSKKAASKQDFGADYNPGKRNYHPINDAFWSHGEKVPYLALTRTFEIIEEISGRLRTIEIVANFLRSVIVLSPNDLHACVYLCLNQLAPAYEGLELGVAETSLMKVIAQTTGRSMNQIKADSKETGDLGIVAERSKSNQRMMFVPAPLTVNGVFLKLKEIARMSGHSAMSKKVDKIQAIFVSCRHSEARYFIRSLLGKLRIGLAEQSLLQAVGMACTLTPPNQREYPPKILCQSFKNEIALKAGIDEATLQVKTTYCQCPNYDKIIAVLLADGIDALLDKCQMMPGTPLKPMLAHPTKGVHEVLQRFDGIKFTCEYKYDGERAQIHIADDGTVNIYSRNQENNTTKYPDIISRVNLTRNETVKSCILDCEAVAWDTETEQILPFQVLSTRKRKDANEAEIKVKVCVFMFDLLYLNGEPLVTRPFVERRQLLREHFAEVHGQWKFATSLDTSDIDELQNFLDISVKGNCEGLMVKTLEKDATYEIAKRSRNWLKLKKDYLSGVGDSLDLIVIGGFMGKGKRTGTYGGFLLACYDADNEQYQSICKIGTGFSDDDLQKHTEFLKPHVISTAKSYYTYDPSNEPDEWFEPIQIWEVLCADLSLSPVHKAAIGIVDPEKGISLRFPRFIRIRDDKSVEDATSAQQVADMYWNQDQIKNQDKTGKTINEEDFY